MAETLNLALENLKHRVALAGIDLAFDPAVAPFLLDGIDDVNFGTRTGRRRVTQLVENEIANQMIARRGEGKFALRVRIEQGKIAL